MFEKFRIKITILATLIITAYCFFQKTDFLRTCYSLIITIIIFYTVGTIIELNMKKYIEKFSKKDNENKNQDEKNQENEENEEDIENQENEEDRNFTEEGFFDYNTNQDFFEDESINAFNDINFEEE